MDLPANYTKLTTEERREARNQYVRLQNHKCITCGNYLDAPPNTEITQHPINWQLFPPQFLKYPVHLHHSHDTGMTIGAVHAHCNAYLWQYKGE